MSATRNVYIIIFVMLALPIVFYMLRRRFRSKEHKKRTMALVYMAVMLAADVALCLALYNYTIDRQPLLIAERSAKVIYQAGLAGTDLGQALEEEGIADAVSIQGDASGDWAAFRGARVDMPDKSIEIDGVKMMPVVLEATDGERMVLAMEVADRQPQSKVRDVHIFWPEQVGDLIKSVTFFQVGTVD